jgi:hypothetical protein
MLKRPKHNLHFDEFHSLLKTVFALTNAERALTIFVDLPDARVRENTGWADRRRIAAEWYSTLAKEREKLPFSALYLAAYDNVGTNNNDLPPDVVLAATASDMTTWLPGELVALDEVLDASSVILAPTELSATAPLKNLARRFKFRGATLPGFSRKMIPALSLDYEEIHKRVMTLKERLDRATNARIILDAEGKKYRLDLDLRYRTAHASGGLIREIGTVGNLPSGEAYIVPYEGEQSERPSQSEGTLPVQFGSEIVVYRIDKNRAVEVLSAGPISEDERQRLNQEPAYGNIAELGLGVLGEWGVIAMGSILLDEKLGLHIAFGRSEHFGGITSPSSFRKPENVVHIDRVYVPSSQPSINVAEVTCAYEGGKEEMIMREGKYLI